MALTGFYENTKNVNDSYASNKQTNNFRKTYWNLAFKKITTIFRFSSI